MLFNTLVLLIQKRPTEALREKIDTLWTLSRLTDEEYSQLCAMFPAQ